MKKPRSIEEFVAEQKKKENPCWACRQNDSVVGALNDARTRGYSIKRILSWAVEDLGLKEATYSRLDNHFDKHIPTSKAKKS